MLLRSCIVKWVNGKPFSLANIDPDEGESIKHSKIARIEYDSNNFEWEKKPSIIKIVINIETKGIFHKKIKQDL